MISLARLKRDSLAPNLGAEQLTSAADPVVDEITNSFGDRSHKVTDKTEISDSAKAMARERFDEWIRRSDDQTRARRIQSEKKIARYGQPDPTTRIPCLGFVYVPTSMREVEPGVRLVMQDKKRENEPGVETGDRKEKKMKEETNHEYGRREAFRPSQLLWTYGPGALIDLPNLSVLTMGTDKWDRTACKPLHEPKVAC